MFCSRFCIMDYVTRALVFAYSERLVKESRATAWLERIASSARALRVTLGCAVVDLQRVKMLKEDIKRAHTNVCSFEHDALIDECEHKLKSARLNLSVSNSLSYCDQVKLALLVLDLEQELRSLKEMNDEVL